MPTIALLASFSLSGCQRAENSVFNSQEKAIYNKLVTIMDEIDEDKVIMQAEKEIWFDKLTNAAFSDSQPFRRIARFVISDLAMDSIDDRRKYVTDAQWREIIFRSIDFKIKFSFDFIDGLAGRKLYILSDRKNVIDGVISDELLGLIHLSHIWVQDKDILDKPIAISLGVLFPPYGAGESYDVDLKDITNLKKLAEKKTVTAILEFDRPVIDNPDYGVPSVFESKWKYKVEVKVSPKTSR